MEKSSCCLKFKAGLAAYQRTLWACCVDPTGDSSLPSEYDFCGISELYQVYESVYSAVQWPPERQGRQLEERRGTGMLQQLNDV